MVCNVFDGLADIKWVLIFQKIVRLLCLNDRVFGEIFEWNSSFESWMSVLQEDSKKSRANEWLDVKKIEGIWNFVNKFLLRQMDCWRLTRGGIFSTHWRNGNFRTCEYLRSKYRVGQKSFARDRVYLKISFPYDLFAQAPITFVKSGFLLFDANLF
jgi:hypothetical protein